MFRMPPRPSASAVTEMKASPAFAVPTAAMTTSALSRTRAFLSPSCAQKRTLLLGEYLSGNLLLNLPHSQFVWTIPKILRSFLSHDRNLFATFTFS
jgi:hypothetical protein